MSQTPRSQNRFRGAQLNPRQPTPFELAPDAEGRAAIAAELGLSALPALRLTGEIRPAPSDAWEVVARLSAKVVQPCVVTLAPVKTTLSEQVHRIFSPHAAQPEGDDTEMGDEEMEPLGQFIDVEAMMIEALSLALPLYPRAQGAALDEPESETEEETRKPFAGLADLLKKE
ncbi:YceD family protein [Paracoccus sp. NGMCC 1.201697]|uniref:YceD family protein n=1 Tax=Paracoccus broussonetiae subsp. drimophilus TaxID=3373869 RepID=A0ABW7LKL6_9RHOB